MRRFEETDSPKEAPMSDRPSDRDRHPIVGAASRSGEGEPSDPHGDEAKPGDGTTRRASMSRRALIVTGAAAGLAATVPFRADAGGRAVGSAVGGSAGPGPRRGPEMLVPQTVAPVVISDYSGIAFTDGGPRNALEEAFLRITRGEDPLDAVIAGVNIPENDPTEIGVGYGGLPNEDGVVQLDSCCMHGPLKRAGAVAALEGVRHPSRVARAVADYTDHHLLVGDGAREFARQMGFEIEDDLNTDRSRELWLEWRRRVDPGHWLDPERPVRRGGAAEAGEAGRRGRGEIGASEGTAPAVAGGDDRGLALRDRAWRGYQAGLEMVREGLIPAHSFWGTINCDCITPSGDIAGVTTTSGLAWKIPGRAGDSPILGAGLYVDNEVGACGSTGRGEANLFNLTSFFVVEQMRQGMSPTDAGMEGLRRIRASTIDERLLNARGEPAFNVRFFVLNKAGEHAGVQMYEGGESEFGVCTENGAEALPLEGLLPGAPQG